MPIPDRALRALAEGRYAEAEAPLRSHLARHRGDVEAMRLLGVALHHQRRSEEARDVLTSALRIAPEQALLHTNLGSVLRRIGTPEACLAAFARACELDPGQPAAWYNLGKNAKALGCARIAVDPLRRAIELQPTHASAHWVLGDTLKALGDVAGAATAYRCALAVNPRSGEAWWGLANLKVVECAPPDVETMTALLRTSDLATDDRVRIGFALARAREQAGDFDAAFTALETANHLQRGRVAWDARAFTAMVDEIVAAFPVERCNPDTGAGREVIFVVGMPRSGSTLVEQILASHPEVCGASELPDLPEVLAAETRRTGRPLAAWAREATGADWQRLGTAYLERTRRWRAERPRHVDKLPENIVHVGAALAMLPSATIVRTWRDPVDTGLSCYQQFFASGREYSYDLDELADYAIDERRLAAHWAAAAPARVLEVGYEALVGDPDPQIRRLLRACGLPFDDACLSPHRTRREVRTASAAQVLEPIDRRGIDRWRPYADRLAQWRRRIEQRSGGTG